MDVSEYGEGLQKDACKRMESAGCELGIESAVGFTAESVHIRVNQTTQPGATI